ncbi:uncharacterized protein LOC129867350 isoform X2 [Salvelinus fontinalis]|uniref:uncharacterized protein LOC129867350 isoform X2 n=1 Tax=Salvelinus fontinalis TaxID=8038 RepID=UPI002485481C|nr:uncharacterized protein LOC129867350 isoform X2 [Salvelinus fontinalis]
MNTYTSIKCFRKAAFAYIILEHHVYSVNFYLRPNCRQVDIGMGRRNQPRATRPEIGDKRVTPDPLPMVVGAVKCVLPRKTALKLIKACEVTTNIGSSVSNTYERLDNRVVKICVNLWPVLASAKEPVEESSDSLDEEEPGTSTDTRTFNTSKSGEQRPRDQERRPHVRQELDRAKASRLVKPILLPPISKLSPTTRLAHSECMGMPVSHTSLPQICVSDQDALVKSSKGTKANENKAPFPMILLQKTSTLMDSTIISQCRSAQVHLPEISVSSIEGLLQRVAERVGRRERKRDETSGLNNPDHLLMAGALRNLREKRLQHRGDYSSEGAVRCPEVKPIGGQKGTTLVTENVFATDSMKEIPQPQPLIIPRD